MKIINCIKQKLFIQIIFCSLVVLIFIFSSIICISKIGTYNIPVKQTTIEKIVFVGDKYGGLATHAFCDNNKIFRVDPSVVYKEGQLIWYDKNDYTYNKKELAKENNTSLRVLMLLLLLFTGFAAFIFIIEFQKKDLSICILYWGLFLLVVFANYIT